jgi:hypothetical protein
LPELRTEPTTVVWNEPPYQRVIPLKSERGAGFSGDMLDPFHHLNAYLWLGAAAAFALAAAILLILTRLSSR